MAWRKLPLSPAGHHEVGHGRGDVVQVAHASIRLPLGLADLHPLHLAFGAGHQADHLFLGVELLGHAQLFLAPGSRWPATGCRRAPWWRCCLGPGASGWQCLSPHWSGAPGSRGNSYGFWMVWASKGHHLQLPGSRVRVASDGEFLLPAFFSIQPSGRCTLPWPHWGRPPRPLSAITWLVLSMNKKPCWRACSGPSGCRARSDGCSHGKAGHGPRR